MHRFVTGASALVILAALAGSPTAVVAHESSKLCNTLVDGDGEPVLGGDTDRVSHGNTIDCPAEEKESTAVDNTGSASETVVAEPTAVATVDPLSVYFDVGKDDLDAGAQAEVKAYVTEVLATSPKSLSVVGYTDTSGSVELNRKLSEARAKNVAAALLDAGVPADIVTRGASGEEGLAVETPDNTREASNRRVTITPSY